jgi:hypothetical protein
LYQVYFKEEENFDLNFQDACLLSIYELQEFQNVV